MDATYPSKAHSLPGHQTNAALLNESQDSIEHGQLMRVATSVPGRVSINGKGPPNWKTALLVLGLFPIVMLEVHFFGPILTSFGLHAPLATFISNIISVAGTTFLTMPLFIRWFGWWLFTEKKTSLWITPACLGFLGALFDIEVEALWFRLPW
jgi:hypothetical protein